MSGRHRILSAGLGALAGATLSTLAYAGNVILGEAWLNDPNVTDATIANIPAAPADATFWESSSPLNLVANGGAYTLGDFISSGGGGFITGSSNAGASLDNTFFAFLGLVTMIHGETITVTHDDGIQLQIDGVLVVDSPKPTSAEATSFTWTGASGIYPFVMAYGECCGPPAALYIDLPLTAIPEIPTWAMLAAGFAGLGFVALNAGRKKEISIVA